ncbi:hypothetical protein ABGB17_23800 [Sphaerisporangium sp. B11E5]|uniref:hypothetical protein n=1 Tax=Sphaerisporangium sp. B11E5 TaxID=3153563 RepID=UPI00325C52EB
MAGWWRHARIAPIIGAGALILSGSGAALAADDPVRHESTAGHRLSVRLVDTGGPLRPGDSIRPGMVARFHVRIEGPVDEALLTVTSNPQDAPVAVRCAREQRLLPASTSGRSPGGNVCRFDTITGARTVDVRVTVPEDAEEIGVTAVAQMRDPGGVQWVKRMAGAEYPVGRPLPLSALDGTAARGDSTPPEPPPAAAAPGPRGAAADTPHDLTGPAAVPGEPAAPDTLTRVPGTETAEPAEVPGIAEAPNVDKAPETDKAALHEAIGIDGADGIDKARGTLGSAVMDAEADADKTAHDSPPTARPQAARDTVATPAGTPARAGAVPGGTPGWAGAVPGGTPGWAGAVPGGTPSQADAAPGGTPARTGAAPGRVVAAPSPRPSVTLPRPSPGTSARPYPVPTRSRQAPARPKAVPPKFPAPRPLPPPTPFAMPLPMPAPPAGPPKARTLGMPPDRPSPGPLLAPMAPHVPPAFPMAPVGPARPAQPVAPAQPGQPGQPGHQAQPAQPQNPVPLPLAPAQAAAPPQGPAPADHDLVAGTEDELTGVHGFPAVAAAVVLLLAALWLQSALRRRRAARKPPVL